MRKFVSYVVTVLDRDGLTRFFYAMKKGRVRSAWCLAGAEHYGEEAAAQRVADQINALNRGKEAEVRRVDVLGPLR